MGVLLEICGENIPETVVVNTEELRVVLDDLGVRIPSDELELRAKYGKVGDVIITLDIEELGVAVMVIVAASDDKIEVELSLACPETDDFDSADVVAIVVTEEVDG